MRVYTEMNYRKRTSTVCFFKKLNFSIIIFTVLSFIAVEAKTLLKKEKILLDAQEEIWRADKHFLSLIRDEENHLLYSGACKNKKCDAFLKTKNMSLISKDQKAIKYNVGGKNPGAILCKEFLGQKIIYLKDLSGNENTFCLFKDKSFLSSSSLSFLYFQKDKKL